MAMYDTINLWLPHDEAGSINKSKTLQALSNVTTTNKNDGQIYHTGYLKNYRVILSEQGISLKGSLAKYFLPDNMHTLNRSDSARAIEKLSDILHLPLLLADVKRIDLAYNFLMKHEPEAYYPYLGDCQYYQRLMQPKSLYYTNSMRQLVFYNKIAEARLKREVLPDVWGGANILRYESRYTQRLTKQFNKAEIKGHTIIDENFYISLLDKWQSEYEAINKHQKINLNTSLMSSPKDFWKQINLMAINMIGQDKILQEIENLRHQKVFDKPEYYSRLKKEIRKLCNTPDLTASSPLIDELDKKVKAAKKNYR
jgi:hypothetical protein